MNSLELAYHLSTMSVNSNGGMNVPPPPESLSCGSSCSSDFTQEFELDCSRFEATMALNPSVASSMNSLSSSYRSTEHMPMGGLLRSRCSHNLSDLCDASSSTRQGPSSYASGPNAGWGYYVDTPAR